MLDILILFESVFTSCVQWTVRLFDAIGGYGVVIAAFIVVLVVSLILMPLRGDGVTPGGVSDMSRQSIHKATERTRNYLTYKGVK